MTLPQTTSKPPESPLQRVIVARLRADAGLVAKLAPAKGISPAAAAVIDEVKEGQSFPYVRIGDHLSTPSGDLTSFGRQVTVTLHVWTKTNSMGPGQAIADDVVRLLDRQHVALSAALAPLGHRCVRSEHQGAQALDNPGP